MSEKAGRSFVGWVSNPPSWWPDLVVLLLYVVISLAMCWPLPVRFGVEFAGAHSDARVFQWNNWWVRQAIASGKNPMYSDAIYYPVGASLSSHNTNWISSIVALPLHLLFGPVAAYNLTFLLTLFLPAWAMYLLVRHLTGSRAAAFVAGVIFAFFPYHVSGNWDGQMNLANIQWLPLFALLWLRMVERKRIADALWAGIWAAIALLDCLFFPIFLALWGLVWAVWSLIVERECWNRRLFLLGGLTVVVAALLAAPVLIPLALDAGQGSTEAALGYYEGEKATDLLSFVLPSLQHPLLGQLVEPIYAQFQHWRPGFLGYTTLVLGSWGAIKGRRKGALWLASFLLFVLLALGGTLTINGVEYQKIPTLYGLVTRALPALNIIRQASRFNVMVIFSLSVLAGLGVSAAIDGRGAVDRAPVRRGWLVAGALGALILFEYLALPCPTQAAAVSPFYTQLAQEAGDFAILELPLDDFYSRRSLYAQTIHGKRLVNGYLARIPAGAHDFIQGNALLKKLFIRMEVDPRLTDIQREIDLLAANGVRYVVIQKRPLPPHPAVDAGVQAAWRRVFGPQPFYEDDDIAVFKLRPVRQIDPGIATPINDDLALVQVQTRRVVVIGRQMLVLDLLWTARRKMDRDYSCQLHLVDEQGSTTKSYDLISPHFPTSHWTPGVMVAERYALPPIDASLGYTSSAPPGEYLLGVSVSDSVVETAQTVHIVVPEETVLLNPALAEMQVEADVTFGNRLRLIGYTPVQTGDQLTLDLYWQALAAMSTDYKVFVHLLDPATGEIAAQRDWMPRNWSYPTSLWDRQELFIDRMTLDVSGVAAGQYRLAVGVYEPDGDRLAAVDAQGQAAPDNRALLLQLVEVKAP
ncbi:MAG: glycosyltransferase family 39 protein [Anaerolineae bacterium]|nr:glycosyltransferase family 39 protein [Anaerolineae bacterium]